ncbi:MAG: M23 family metallopeptidase [candidate division NC10 bacterium]|nr:M23 family metallopeptidase [candidate division NC10 bacterium]
MLEDHTPDAPIPASPQRRRARSRLLVGGALLAAFLVGGGLFLWGRPASAPAPAVAVSPPAPVIGTLGKGRTLQSALAALGVAKDRAIQIVQALRPHIDFRRLRPQDGLELHQDSTGDPAKLVYRQSPIDIVDATRDGDAWTAARRDVPVDRRVVVVAGTLKANLFESLERLGEKPQLVLNFAEIFAYDFDFAADSQPGDRFRMLVEKVSTNGQFVKYGRILAAQYESEGRTHAGVFFKDKEGNGYYTPTGESLRRAFLKSPLEFTRISSTFSFGRRHPILGGVRPHLAVDYAAPQGTPVWSVADGVVEAAGWSGGNGNTVIVRHRANFKTMYNHLSGFGKGIRAGAPVRQRQVVGYVGMTGLATGPHLDYRIIKDGQFVNPLKQTFLPGKPISPSSRAAFAETRDSLLAQLRAAPASGVGR